MAKKKMMLDVKAMGLAIAITWGVAVVIVGILATNGSYGDAFVDLLGSVYLGYEATALGTVIGGVWAVVDGFIGGAIFAWLYNKLAK